MPNYPIAFPSNVAINSERLTLNRRQAAVESPWSYAVQVVHTASQWHLQWSWPRMSVANAERIAAWGLSLKGQTGTFRYFPRRPASALSNRVLAVPSYAYGDTISVAGWSNGAASQLRPGQWFSIGDQLLRIVDANAVADSAGRITVAFEPELRVGYATGTPVEFANPSGLFRLNDSNGIAYTLDPDRLPEFGTITAREVIG